MKTTLWLVPPESALKEIQDHMKKLRSKYGGPAFVPHITVASGIDCTTPDDALKLMEIYKERIGTMGPIPCSFHSIKSTQDNETGKLVYFQSCMALVDETEKFTTLCQRAQGKRTDLYAPPTSAAHMSLAYGRSCGDDAVVPAPFEANELRLMTFGEPTDEGVEKDFKELARIFL